MAVSDSNVYWGHISNINPLTVFFLSCLVVPPANSSPNASSHTPYYSLYSLSEGFFLNPPPPRPQHTHYSLSYSSPFVNSLNESLPLFYSILPFSWKHSFLDCFREVLWFHNLKKPLILSFDLLPSKGILFISPPFEPFAISLDSVFYIFFFFSNWEHFFFFALFASGKKPPF
jgi:hypothetical protein